MSGVRIGHFPQFLSGSPPEPALRRSLSSTGYPRRYVCTKEGFVPTKKLFTHCTKRRSCNITHSLHFFQKESLVSDFESLLSKDF
jgi:hypothetical protein